VLWQASFVRLVLFSASTAVHLGLFACNNSKRSTHVRVFTLQLSHQAM
jgi:hypothetical protein